MSPKAPVIDDLLKEEGNPTTEILGKKCHIKFIYDYVIYRLYGEHLTKPQLKEFENLVDTFRSERADDYKSELSELLQFLSAKMFGQ